MLLRSSVCLSELALFKQPEWKYKYISTAEFDLIQDFQKNQATISPFSSSDISANLSVYLSIISTDETNNFHYIHCYFSYLLIL